MENSTIIIDKYQVPRDPFQSPPVVLVYINHGYAILHRRCGAVMISREKRGLKIADLMLPSYVPYYMSPDEHGDGKKTG